MSANQLTQSILKILDLKGFHVWRQNNNGVYDPVKKVFRRNSVTKGIPDILGFHKKTGLFICVEIKAGKDRLSPDQIEFLNTVKYSGALQFVVRSTDDIEQILKTITN